jgi:hypothetical protein
MTILCGLLSACVNVSLPKDTQKDPKIQFTAPALPFAEFYPHQIDKAWRHPDSGASISIFTECNNPTAPTNESILKGVLTNLKNNKIERQEEIQINSTEGLHAVAKGSIDQVESKIDVVIFQKNSCLYLLSLMSSVENHKSHEATFKTFILGFKTP